MNRNKLTGVRRTMTKLSKSPVIRLCLVVLGHQWTPFLRQTMIREKLEKQIKLGIVWFCQWEVPNTELRRNKTFVTEIFMKVRMEANGQCQVVWCFLITWHCSGVTLASLSMFQQQPGGSLIHLDETLIAPTVGFPWLFDHIGLWHVEPVTRCPATSHCKDRDERGG